MAVEIDFDKMGGLAPAIVQDAGTGEVLMLGFMNRDAYRKTVETGNLRFRGFVFLARLPVEADRELGVGNHSLHFIGIWTFLAFRIYFGGDVVIGCSRDDGVVSVVG